MFHGYRGHNRWFDKCISMVLDNLGRAGCNGEHSPLDAVVPAIMFDNIVSREPATDPAKVSREPLPPPRKLSWVIDNVIEKALVGSQNVLDGLIADSDVQVGISLNFSSTCGTRLSISRISGPTLLKRSGRCPPMPLSSKACNWPTTRSTEILLQFTSLHRRVSFCLEEPKRAGR